MNTTENQTVEPLADKEAISRTLEHAAARLAVARQSISDNLAHLRNGVVEARTAGILTVAQIANAIGRDRNTVDTIWSATGKTVKGKQTRTAIAEHAADSAQDAMDVLTELANAHRNSTALAKDAREMRDVAVAHAYKGKLLGPSAIAGLVGIDRNHVLRICRKAGVAPVYRSAPKNQYTVQDSK